MNKYGLLGAKLGHSFSPWLHERMGGYPYGLYEVPDGELDKFFKETDLSGMNVTIPYKKRVMEYCTGISDIARRMGAVNLLTRRDGAWYGDNTDYYGFRELLRKTGIDPAGQKALVLGSGGASGTITEALKDLSAGEIVVVSRKGENNYDNIRRHYDAGLIVNTTPLGMYPDNGLKAVELRDFPGLTGVLDVVYNPLRTALVMEAEDLGIPTSGGLYMLVKQAQRTAEIFLSEDLDNTLVDELYEELKRDTENIIIIGMPGAGKSTVAAEVARLTGRKLVETDELIEEAAGRDIPTIFAEDGEEVFRELETRAIENTAKLSGLVISTGGGVVTRPENYHLLHQNGRIYWLKRDLSLLASEGRPISLSKKAEEIYNERKDLYARFADQDIDNDGTIEEAARRILA